MEEDTIRNTETANPFAIPSYPQFNPYAPCVPQNVGQNFLSAGNPYSFPQVNNFPKPPVQGCEPPYQNFHSPYKDFNQHTPAFNLYSSPHFNGNFPKPNTDYSSFPPLPPVPPPPYIQQQIQQQNPQLPQPQNPQFPQQFNPQLAPYQNQMQAMFQDYYQKTEEYKTDKQKYDQDLKKYEEDLKKYQSELKEYNEEMDWRKLEEKGVKFDSKCVDLPDGKEKFFVDKLDFSVYDQNTENFHAFKDLETEKYGPYWQGNKPGDNRMPIFGESGLDHHFVGSILDTCVGLTYSGSFGQTHTNAKQQKIDNEESAEKMSFICGGVAGGGAAVVLAALFPPLGIALMFYVACPDKFINKMEDFTGTLTGGITNYVKEKVGVLMNDKEMAKGEHQKSMTDKIVAAVPEAEKRLAKAEAKTEVAESYIQNKDRMDMEAKFFYGIKDARHNVQKAIRKDPSIKDKIEKFNNFISKTIDGSKIGKEFENEFAKSFKEAFVETGIFPKGGEMDKIAESIGKIEGMAGEQIFQLSLGTLFGISKVARYTIADSSQIFGKENYYEDEEEEEKKKRLERYRNDVRRPDNFFTKLFAEKPAQPTERQL